MKKNIIITTFLVLASLSQLSAQVTDRLVPHFGYMFSQLIFKNPDFPENRTPVSFNSLSIGTYYTLVQSKDIVSVGLDPNLHLGFNFSNTGQINFYSQLPLFVMGRLGANSTVYNTQKIGLGAGVGLMGTYLRLSGNNGLIMNPTAVIEGTLNSRGSNVTGRVMFSLADGRAFDGTFITSTLNLGVIYGF